MAETVKTPKAEKPKAEKPKAEKPKAEAKPRKAPAKKSTAAQTGPIQMHHKSPSHEQVAELARKYWAERGYQDGHQEEDWLRAEQELRAKAS